MNRPLIALFAALEALLVIAIGIAIPLAPLTVLWGAQFGFGPEWMVFWRVAVDVWLLGHGVDVVMTLDPATASGVGFDGAGEPFAVTIAVLGFSLLTVLLGMRVARRIGQTEHGLLGCLVAVVVFACLSLAVAASATHAAAQPSLVQGAVFPAAVFGVGLVLGAGRAGELLPAAWRPETRAGVLSALRGGAAAASGIIAVSAVAVAVLIFTSYARVIALYEGLHTEVLGGAAVTLAQIAILPNLVVWASSWLVGPGFAIGTGSTVGPLATSLGPIPAIPVLGALPVGSVPFGFIGLLVPVVAGFLAAALFGGPRTSMWRALGIALGMGVVGGGILGALAWLSSGSAGPGRLSMVGPDPLQVTLWASAEIGVAAVVGLLAAARASAPDRRTRAR